MVCDLFFCQIRIGFLLGLSSFFLVCFAFFFYGAVIPTPALPLCPCRVAMVIPWMAGERFQLALCKSSADCLLCHDLDCGRQALS